MRTERQGSVSTTRAVPCTARAARCAHVQRYQQLRTKPPTKQKSNQTELEPNRTQTQQNSNPTELKPNRTETQRKKTQGNQEVFAPTPLKQEQRERRQAGEPLSVEQVDSARTGRKVRSSNSRRDPQGTLSSLASAKPAFFRDVEQNGVSAKVRG